MTNGEFYETCMRRIEDDYGSAVAIINGKPNPCELKCEGCLRTVKTGESKRCSDLKLIEWLNSEYILQKPKLTKRQRAFCECVETGWLVRQPSGYLALFVKKPERACVMFNCTEDDEYESVYLIDFRFPDFPFIKNENEPISIEEMLTWEVEE